MTARRPLARPAERTDFQILREKMAQGLEAAGIQDRRLLSAIRKLPRHAFVPEPLWSQAYQNATLPIGFKQTMTQPLTVAVMLQALKLGGSERVLEIGTGSGYQAALLALLAQAVFSVERIAELAREAQSRLREIGIINVTIKNFDGTYGWSEYAPYDAIVVSATAPAAVPRPLIEQLAPGGRMAIPLARQGHEEICLVTRMTDGIDIRPVSRCTFVPLVGRFGYTAG